jgi:type I restriction enzyme S subunit
LTDTRTARPNLAARSLTKFEIPLPPLSEQRRIVGILDEAFAGIATAKANAEKNLQNARALFESHLNAVFTQRGDGWTDTTLGEACENIDSRRIPITKNKRTAGEFPYYGASGIVDYVNDYIFDEDLLLVSEDGANLLARTYPIAFSVSGKVWVNNHAHVVRFPEMASQRFMEFYLNSIKLAPYVSGMAQPKLNQKSLNSIPVPSPPLPQRKAIVANLDSLQDEIQRLESIYQRKLAALDELKKSLLHQAFSGELTPSVVDESLADVCV